MADHTSSDAYVERSGAVLRRIFAAYDPPDMAARLWDGSQPISPASGEPRFTLVFKHPAALRRMFLPPSERNLGEAYIFGDFEIEGDIIASAGLIDYFPRMQLSAGDVLWLTRQLLALPADWDAETDRPALRLTGPRHSKRRDLATVQFHYDVSNEFYALWLDDWMNYSCAYFRTGEEDLHSAQQQKMELICRKLRLQPGERLLDIGCGWGGLAIYAARRYGVDVTGITLSERQVELARERIEELGLSDRCRVELIDYRDVPADRPFDKLVSVGMFEHVGLARLPTYFTKAWNLLKPGGMFLNHGIASMKAHFNPGGLLNRLFFRPNGFMQRYVFPDGELVDIHQTLQAAEGVGFEVRDVESLREHYARTLRHWATRLEANRDAALNHVDDATYRVWRIYMAACSHSFATSRINVYQALLSKNAARGASGLPWTRERLYA